MNKIVREHYPVDRLPEDLRAQFEAGSTVTVSVSEETVDRPRKLRSVTEVLEAVRKLQHASGGRGLTPDEAAREVSALRDEWDD